MSAHASGRALVERHCNPLASKSSSAVASRWTMVAFSKWSDFAWVFSVAAADGPGVIRRLFSLADQPDDWKFPAFGRYEKQANSIAIETTGEHPYVKKVEMRVKLIGAGFAGETQLEETTAHPSGRNAKSTSGVVVLVDDTQSLFTNLEGMHRCNAEALAAVR